MDEHTNDDRADAAETAMNGYDEMQDLLSDLMHLADRKEAKQLESFWDALRMARGHYHCEIDPNDDISPGVRLGQHHDDGPVGWIEVDESEPGEVLINIPALAGLSLTQRTYPTAIGLKTARWDGIELIDGVKGSFSNRAVTIL